MKKDMKFILPLGFTLFAIMFGAGNIIYPPAVGRLAGDNWLIAIICFILTATGFALIGFLGLVVTKNGYIDITKRIHPKLHLILLGVIFIIIGPLFAIPRTAIVTNELLFSNFIEVELLSKIIASTIFFGLTGLLIFKGNGVVDIVGKYLTPILVSILAIIIITSIINPHGTGSNGLESTIAGSVNNGLSEGYFTLDGLAYFVLFGVAFTYIVKENFESIKAERRNKIAIKASIVAVIMIALVYIGLGYMGSISDLAAPIEGAPKLGGTDILKDAIMYNFNEFGIYLFGTAAALACLTTSIGLSDNAAAFFEENVPSLKGKFNLIVFVILGISFALSLIDLALLQEFIVPILAILYPISAYVGVTGFYHRFIRHDKTLVICMITVGILAIFSYLGGPIVHESIKIEALGDMMNIIPLNQVGLSWLPLSILAVAILFLVDRKIFKEV